jgi:hypothetical protein
MVDGPIMVACFGTTIILHRDQGKAVQICSMGMYARERRGVFMSKGTNRIDNPTKPRGDLTAN